MIQQQQQQPKVAKAVIMMNDNKRPLCLRPTQPRVSAYDIHEWVEETLRLQENKVVIIQIGGARRHVCIKFRDPQRMQAILTATRGQEVFRPDNGEISKVRIDAVGLGMRRVKVANVPPEVADRTLKMVLGAYGEIRDIQVITW